MPFCSNCGVKTLESANFCGGCGHPLNNVSAPNSNNSSLPEKSISEVETLPITEAPIKNSKLEPHTSEVLIKSLPLLLNSTNKAQLIINGEEQKHIFLFGEEQKVNLAIGKNTIQVKVTSGSFLKLKTNTINLDVSPNSKYLIQLNPNELIPGFNLKLKKT